MKPVFIIASNTFREIIRDRILYGLVVFSLILISISTLLGQLSFAEQVRISMDFGLTAIHLGTIILSIFVGSTLVIKEIDKKTIMTILTRPISRTQFILGKALGLCLVNLLVVTGLCLVLVGVLYGMNAEFSSAFFISLVGIFFEGLILLGVTLFFSTFSTAFMVVSFSIGVFLIGHWLDSLSFFVQQSQSGILQFGEQVLHLFVPNLETLNWRGHAVYAEVIPVAELGYAVVYSLCWFVIMVLLTSLVIRKKDFA